MKMTNKFLVLLTLVAALIPTITVDAAAPPFFRVYLTSAQLIQPPASPTGPIYFKVKFNAVSRDETGWFDTTTNSFNPQASGTLSCSWQVWDQAGVFNSQGYGITAKLIGADSLGNDKSDGSISQDTAAIGTLGSYANTAQSQSSAIVHVDAGDKWAIWNYVMSTSPPTAQVTIDPNPAHTYLFCMFYAS